ncbi:MBL fold metallo-hydrolase [Granulicoccus sp. GXG6511]|uniref:MBL fold metallo-hydrolase n=1 Tax=Granulicoccus sp. GXG6511 TaxID=3381351 RepID=UPI003D7C530A
MELTIIGCSGSASGPKSPASCYLVRHDGFNLVLDMGPGSFGGLWRHIAVSDVHAIAFSHLHPDHCLDLCAFNVAALYSASAPWRRIPVYGPPDTQERMSRANEPVPGTPTDWAVDFVAWEETQQVGPFTVRLIPAPHSAPAWSIRLEAGGRSLVYSGDTGPNPGLIEFARGADLLLAEASFLHAEDLPPDLHLSGRQAAEHAAAAGVPRLVITHVPPWHEVADVFAEARPHFGGELQMAYPGLSVTLD